MIRLGYQIPYFNYEGVDRVDLFENVAAQATTAEASGFDTVLVMDHFYQLPMIGQPDDWMLECYALLSALAARTSTIRLSSLVSGNTYRNPAMLAKIVTTLDIISKGRAICGIGCGWFEHEHSSLGFEFGTFSQRFDKLDEALRIIAAMFRDERPTMVGEYYNVHDAINQPRPVQPGGVPILIGGSGEKRTLRLVAQYAQESNLTCSPAEIPRKMEALEAHCTALGRDRSEIEVSWLGSLLLAPDADAAIVLRDEFFRRRGVDWDTLDDHSRADLSARMLIGDPESVAEQVQTKLIDRGIDGLTLNMIANGHDLDMLALAGETLAPLMN